mgnify:CR=1 FL=1
MKRHFRADHSGKKFLDATRKSCTEFIADVARNQFGFDDEPLRDLIHWAHIIDGALYESAGAVCGIERAGVATDAGHQKPIRTISLSNRLSVISP